MLKMENMLANTNNDTISTFKIYIVNSSSVLIFRLISVSISNPSLSNRDLVIFFLLLLFFRAIIIANSMNDATTKSRQVHK